MIESPPQEVEESPGLDPAEAEKSAEVFGPMSPVDVPKPTDSRFTDDVLDDIFCYHAPRPDQLPKYQAIREAARVFAGVLIKNTPGSADQTVAIRKLRELVMSANQSIALDGKY